MAGKPNELKYTLKVVGTMTPAQCEQAQEIIARLIAGAYLKDLEEKQGTVRRARTPPEHLEGG